MNFTNKWSMEFKLRLHSNVSKVVAERDAFINALNTDPDVHTKAASSIDDAIEDMFELHTTI